MAGSYMHCVKDDGSLREPKDLNGMLENGGDVYEAVEEMYGMIWYLADSLETIDHDASPLFSTTKEWIEEARKNYKQGIEISPTDREALF